MATAGNGNEVVGSKVYGYGNVLSRRLMATVMCCVKGQLATAMLKGCW
jgi:hypothetical protein